MPGTKCGANSVKNVFLEIVLPVGRNGDDDFGDFVHLEKCFQAILVNGLGAEKHQLLGNCPAHALAETASGENCCKFSEKLCIGHDRKIERFVMLVTVFKK